MAFVLAIPVSLVMFPFLPHVDRGWWSELAVAVCFYLAYVGLESFLLIRRRGRTLGKGLLGIRVVPSRPGASPYLGVWAVAIRPVVLYLPVFLGSVGGDRDSTLRQVLPWIGTVGLIVTVVLAALRWSSGRAIHDYVAGTRVVLAPKRGDVLGDDLRMMVPGS